MLKRGLKILFWQQISVVLLILTFENRNLTNVVALLFLAVAIYAQIKMRDGLYIRDFLAGQSILFVLLMFAKGELRTMQEVGVFLGILALVLVFSAMFRHQFQEDSP
jgi:hypothetical protein